MKLVRYLFFSICFGLVGQSLANTELGNKIVLRTGAGLLSNTGTISGSSPTFGGFDLQYHYFLDPRLAVGFGYTSQFDLQSKGIPSAGFEIIGRVYYLKSGTRETIQGADWNSTFHQQWSPYFGAFYARRSYYLGEDTETSATAQLTGSYVAVNAITGVDYRLNNEFELNAEFSATALSFVASDPRVKISETVVWFGVNYVF